LKGKNSGFSCDKKEIDTSIPTAFPLFESYNKIGAHSIQSLKATTGVNVSLQCIPLMCFEIVFALFFGSKITPQLCIAFHIS
jgi:hypothetical protein